MTTTNQTHFTNAVIRMVIVSRMMEQDSGHFMKATANGAVKQALKRIKDNTASNLNIVISAYDAKAQALLEQCCNEDKVASIHNIVSRIALMDTESLAELENQIIEATKIQTA